MQMLRYASNTKCPFCRWLQPRGSNWDIRADAGFLGYNAVLGETMQGTHSLLGHMITVVRGRSNRIYCEQNSASDSIMRFGKVFSFEKN